MFQRVAVPCLSFLFLCLFLPATTFGQDAKSPDSGDPSKKTARFRDLGKYVEDTQTGLLWQKDGTESGKRNYYEAEKYAANLKLGGLSGWRVPTAAELAAIYPAVDAPFTNTKYNKQPYNKGTGEWNSYWTAELDRRQADYAYVYQWYAEGGANNCFASKTYVYVRCVHDPVKKK